MMYDINNLEKRANDLRIKFLDFSRETGLKHFGGGFSCIELLVSLYDVILKEEDRFILSKGHACPPLYVILKEKGFNPKISGHPDIDPKNGIYCTTGSLGMGLPQAAGMAFARKLNGLPGNFYVLMSDGECQEGTLWESSLAIEKLKLDNLTAIIDYNKIQASGPIEDGLPLGNLGDKLRALGWVVKEIDGHDFSDIIPALQKKPFKQYAIIAHTTKGKGVSFMENDPLWHSEGLTDEQYARAYTELRRYK